MTSDFLDCRLRHWARWMNNDFVGLGYPCRSIEATIQEYGGSIPKATGGKPPMVHDEDAEEIERLVMVELRGYRAELAEAIKLEYFIKGGARRKSKILSCSKDTYRMRVREAVAWLEGRISTLQEDDLR